VIDGDTAHPSVPSLLSLSLRPIMALSGNCGLDFSEGHRDPQLLLRHMHPPADGRACALTEHDRVDSLHAGAKAQRWAGLLLCDLR
jgi:hypothetical protein